MNCLSKSAAGNALLLDHVAGHLRGSHADQVAKHLRSCETCREQVNAQSKVWDLLDSWDPAPVSPAFNRELYARIQQTSSFSLARFLGDLLNQCVARPAMPLATLTLLVIAGFFIDRPSVPTAAVQVPVETPAAVSPNDAEQLDKALDDLQLLHQLDLVKDEAGASHGM